MAEDNSARSRAHMPEATRSFVNQRTLKESHRRLVDILNVGNDVLDVGCSTGTITSGIAKMVQNGKVIGMDENKTFIKEANKTYAQQRNLSFIAKDIYEIDYLNQFDVVTSARVLQWLSNPEKALKKMVAAAKVGGSVVVLDYNHEKILWQPDPPKSMQHFYQAFLQWRSEVGMDNRIADHLAGQFSKCGLVDVHLSAQHEVITKDDPEFIQKMDIWAGVAETRGHQLVQDGYLSEYERGQAVKDYRAWITTSATSMNMYLLAVSGRKISME